MENMKHACESCNREYKPTPPNTNWEERFDREFGDATLGILSGGKNSPVFVNNDLEMPRLKNFIRAEIKKAESSAYERVVEILEGMNELYELRAGKEIRIGTGYISLSEALSKLEELKGKI